MPSCKRRRRPVRGIVILLAVLLLLTGVGATAPASAQTTPADSLCTWDACGLRQLGDGFFQGLDEERAGGIGVIYGDLAVLRTGPPEAVRLAEAALRDHRIAVYAFLVGFPPYTLVWASLNQPGLLNRNPAAAVGVAAVSLVAAVVSGVARQRARRHLSEGVWHYNAAVAAGDLPLPGELPPPDPSHHGRFGIFAGSTAGVLTGTLVYQRADELLPAVAAFAATTFLGYLFGGSVSRER